MSKPLEGIRVLDLSHMLPGPFATMMMADMGAEVIKVENPSGGDGFRGRKPFLSGEGTAYLMLNRSKKSVVVDLKSEQGKEFFMKLVESADVIVEQFKPGTASRLGIGYDDVVARNPRIVYCSISGYGQEGDLAPFPGHDINYLSMAGVLDVIGQEASAPVVPGVQMADINGAQWALVGILGSLMSRERDGKGRFIDVALSQCMIPWLSLCLDAYAAGGALPKRGETKGTGRYACYRVYETADGRYVTLGAAEPKFWQRFCTIVGRTDLVEDQYSEGDRRKELIKAVEELFASKSLAYWTELFAGEQVCFTPVRTFEEVAHDENYAKDGRIGLVENPRVGTHLNLGFPVPSMFDSNEDAAPAPSLGEQTEEYLAKLGFDEAFIERYVGTTCGNQ